MALTVVLLAVCLLAGGSAARAQDTATLTVLYGFSDNSIEMPSDLVQGSDGNFYGTTYFGGTYSTGTVFRITPAGELTILHSFSEYVDGINPAAALVQGSDGNFYGTASYGGGTLPNGDIPDGTVFQITPSGTLTTLHLFDYSDGSEPEAALVQGSDGNFYGTTSYGGNSTYGTVFKITPAGGFTMLHSFSNSDGNQPTGLVQGNDGNFYGTTTGGGTNGDGTVFRITPSGSFTTLYSFGGSDGESPKAALALGSDGNFYGTTSEGGAASDGSGGTLFTITPAGSLTTLHSFDYTDGFEPMARLVRGSDGNFYGTTSSGGTSGSGTAFEFTAAGTLTTLHSFAGNDGSSPGGLVQGSDGNFYGTTSAGGSDSTGTVFKLAIGAASALPAFFTGEVSLGNGVYYLSFPDGNFFGYYSFLTDPSYIYHFDLGYEYVFDANDGNSGVYLYDFASSDFFYTSPGFPFPYLYDFGLNSVVYYYPDPDQTDRPGRYNTDGVRYFYVFNTGEIISK